MEIKPKEIKLAPIRNGTVIDHIATGEALNVLKILGVNEYLDSTISVGIHVSSNKAAKWKDIIKIEDCELDQKTVDKIALIAPDATISIIRDYYVAEKFEVALGDRVIGLAKCCNPNCITNKNEPIETEFFVVSRRPTRLRCFYCDRELCNVSDSLL